MSAPAWITHEHQDSHRARRGLRNGPCENWTIRPITGIESGLFSKTFGHPVNIERLAELLRSDSRILDFGCGYGRIRGLLPNYGYTNVIGVDPAPAMVDAARVRFPDISFQELVETPHLDIDDASVDATFLFTVLTCVPSDDGQRSIIREIS